MKTPIITLLSLVILLLTCCSPASQKLQCLEEYVTTDSYRSNFAAIEQALLAQSSLQGTDGQAYRQLAQEAVRRNDLDILIPISVDLSSLQESYACLNGEEGRTPEILEKLFMAMDSVEQTTNLSPAVIVGAFLHHFDDDDWDKPLTKHLFYAFVSYHVTIDKGIMIKLPKWQNVQPNTLDLEPRNAFSVLVDAENRIFVRGVEVELDTIREMASFFLSNPTNAPDQAKSPQQAVIILKSDLRTSYEAYLAVYNELRAAYTELWDVYCQVKFGHPYSDELPIGIYTAVREAIPFNLAEVEPTEF